MNPLTLTALSSCPPSPPPHPQPPQGLYYEALGRPERAQELYEATLKEQPHNMVLPKRLAALHRGGGDLPAAIEVLRGYLDTWSNDRDAWEELAESYLV